MKGKLIASGAVGLGLLFAADHFGGHSVAVPWEQIIGLPLVGLVVAYMFYLMFLKQSGDAANAEHDKRVAKRMPKFIACGIGALFLAGAIPHFGPILVDHAKTEAGQAAGGITTSIDTTTTGAAAALPPVWVMITVPLLAVVSIEFIARGRDAEAKTVRGTAVALAALAGVIVIATGVVA
jgi:dipeptide/tripeptide permease